MTNLATGGCATGTSTVTDFGSVLPGTSNVTSNDCSVTWGSSNDTSMLELSQEDGVGVAMTRMAWASVGAPIPGTALDIEFAPGVGVGFTTTAGGGIAKTTDAGATWTAQASGTSLSLGGVAVVDPLTAWAVGSGGTILATTNGGATWSAQASGVASTLNDVDAASSSVAWAVGGANTILKTTDGGTTWVAQASGQAAGTIFSHVTAIDASNAWIAGSSGTILRTTNGGTTWTSQPSGVGAAMHAVVAFDGMTAWAVGDSGTVLKTVNGGVSWTTQVSGSSSVLFAGVALSSTSVWLAGGYQGVILKTTDGGTTWTDDAAGTTNQLRGIAMLPSGAGAVVGDSMLHTPSTPVADYATGTADWTVGSDMFGACLRAVSGLGVTGTWTANAACPATNGTYWHSIPTSPLAAAKVASSGTTGTIDATVQLRFGFRTGTAQKPGRYSAPLLFTVIAPDA
jgi:photosystem II stability/assembly factor-like uncharacterized protein